MAIKTKATQSSKKDTQAPAKKAPAKTTTAKKEAPKKEAPKKAAPAKAPAKPQVKATAKATASTKTTYHVSKRDNDGREWKVFIQESKKVIKLFGTQQEALDYAKALCKNKNDGSYVILHGLDGKIRKF